MKPLPQTENPLLVRTDFSDLPAWERLCRSVRRSYGRLPASVAFIDDAAYAGLAGENVLNLAAEGYTHSFIILADRTTFITPGRPLLVIDLLEDPGRSFRAVPSQVQGIETNLSLGNMSFSEFADHVDADGIFRGFPMPWFARLLMKILKYS